MNKTIQYYLGSFKLGKQFAATFLIDLAALSIILFSFIWFSSYAQRRSFELLQGRSAAELQQMMLSVNPEQLLPFMSALKWFLATSIIGLAVLSIGSLFLFSYSRAGIWNFLHGKKVTSSNYWRWNLLIISLSIPFLLFLSTLIVVKLLTGFVLNLFAKLMPLFYLSYPDLMQNVRLVVDNAVLFYMIVLFAAIIFLIYDNFVKSYRIWDSIGSGFSFFKKNWKKALLLALFATASALVAAAILIPIRKALIFYPYYPTILNTALAAFFFSWLRWYVYTTLLHGHQ